MGLPCTNTTRLKTRLYGQSSGKSDLVIEGLVGSRRLESGRCWCCCGGHDGGKREQSKNQKLCTRRSRGEAKISPNWVFSERKVGHVGYYVGSIVRVERGSATCSRSPIHTLIGQTITLSMDFVCFNSSRDGCIMLTPCIVWTAGGNERWPRRIIRPISPV